MNLDVLLVGSIPLADAEQVFRTVGSILGDHVLRIPDGETGVRSNWIGWQYEVFAGHPDFEPVEAEASRPVPRFRLRSGVDPGEVHFDRLGYAAAATAAHAVFQRLKADAVVPERTRLQVCLPTPFAPVSAFVVPEQQAALEPAYSAALFRELEDIVRTIPADQLAIQWDAALEFAVLEGVVPAYFESPETEIPQRLVRLGQRVPHGVELGYHLCYGDSDHRHFVEPADTARLVMIANAICEGLERAVDWIHLPVPRDRSDDAYFAPLQGLKLQPGTRLYLGLVHATDGVSGTRERIAAAHRAVSEFGIATECGMGRRPPDTIPQLLRTHAALAKQSA